MSPKITRPGITSSYTIMLRSNCGKIFITITYLDGKPFEVFIRFGKAGGCSSAMGDGMARLISFGLRSGMSADDAVKALFGIGCHLGPNTCLNAVASAINLVNKHLETGVDLNQLIEEEDFAKANVGGATW